METYNSLPSVSFPSPRITSRTPSRSYLSKLFIVSSGLLLLTALFFVASSSEARIRSLRDNVLEKVADITHIPINGHSKPAIDGLYDSYMRAVAGKIEFLTPTGDCYSGLHCRAVLTFSITDDKVVVSAGYTIRPISGDTKAVDSRTKDRISKVTLQEAMKWAEKLMEKAAGLAKEYEITLNQEEIAKAILGMAPTAATCEIAGADLCDSFDSVQEISLEENMDGWVFRLYNIKHDPQHLCLYSSTKQLGSIGGGVLWPDQSWKLEKKDGGYLIRNNFFTDYFIMGSGIRALTKPGPVTEDYVWSVEKFENGTMRFKNVGTNGYLMLYRPGQAYAPPWDLNVLMTRFGPMLEWTMDVLSKPSDKSLSGEELVIRSAYAPTTALKVFSVGTTVGTVEDMEGIDAQWYLEATGKGEHTYYIKNMKYPEVWMQRGGTSSIIAAQGVVDDNTFMWRVNKQEDEFYVISTYMRPELHITFTGVGIDGTQLSLGVGSDDGKDEWSFERTV